jgi:predicted anti-sigma-YlaC factor YlaD
MNPHMSEWLSAYYDGELHGERLRQVETHLASCTACRDELQALHRLSTVLWENPALHPVDAPGRFAERVLAGLPASRPTSAWRTALVAVYALLPALLIGAWALLQAGAVGIGLAWLSPLEVRPIGFGVTGLGLAWLVGVGGGLPGGFTAGLWNLLNLALGGFGGLGTMLGGVRFILLYLSATAAIAVLLWSWLAGWWAYQRHLQFEPQGRLEKDF